MCLQYRPRLLGNTQIESQIPKISSFLVIIVAKIPHFARHSVEIESMLTQSNSLASVPNTLGEDRDGPCRGQTSLNAD